MFLKETAWLVLFIMGVSPYVDDTVLLGASVALIKGHTEKTHATEC